MPSVFKALATIVAWVLFVFGLLALLVGLIRVLSAIPATAAPGVVLMSAYFGFGIISLTLSVVVMKLRQTF
ncbi:MAG: hypothetical protein HYX79_06965 [Chloroflexi bacterium]|nr:hypothetical protein [Chloroflexota bacterium]